MKILGFYLGGHDSNVSLVNDCGEIRYYKAERMYQHKHKKADLNWISQLCKEKQFVPEMICYSDGNRNGLGSCETKELYRKVAPIKELFNVDTYLIDHHYAHILSSWFLAKEPISYGVSIDGRGDNNIKCSILQYPFEINKVEQIYKSVDRDYCLTFNKIGKLMRLTGGELDYAGKIMGLHAYGTVDETYYQKHLTKQFAEQPSLLLEEDFRGTKISELYDTSAEKFNDWIATFHSLVEAYIVDMFQQYIPYQESVVYTGGCAQNTVYNERLNGLYQKLLIPPHCYDGGISLGCIKLISMLTNTKITMEGFPFCQESEDVGYADDKTIQQVKDLLAEGKIVGWCQGKGEIGPRALGHRSLLMHPGLAEGKEILNTRVKKRESWRPYAASIKIENIKELIGEEREFPYMLHAAKVKEEFYPILQSVIHVDGTCRFQTVANEGVMQSYYQLLDLFEQQCGVTGLLNTSLNLGGKPIVSGRTEAMQLFEVMDIDAICIGNDLYIKDKR